MRGRFHALVMLALLAAPAQLRAQAPAAAPAPQQPPCAVAADESWSDQEKFVWRRACAGLVADFNAEPGYGGSIDPQKAPLTANRILRSSFITAVLTQDKFADAIKQGGLRVTGARFVEQLELSNAELRNELWFEGCSFDRGADLSWLKTTQPLAFNTSKVTGGLNFYAAQFAADLHVRGSAVDQIKVNGAHVGRALDLSRSRATGEVGLRGADIGTNLWMRESEVGGPLQMDGVRVGGNLDLDHASLHAVSLIGARAQQMTFEGAKVLGEVGMFDAQVATDLWMATAEFSQVLRLSYIQIGGQLDWSGTKFHEDVDLTGARIGGALQLAAAQWINGAGLVARFAEIGVIPRLSDSWPDVLEIDGLTYHGLAAVGDAHEPWLAKIKRYSRQPYEQLAGVLQGQGEIARATAVRFAERERDRTRSQQSWYIGAWLWLLKWMIGYGYYPYLSLAWVAGFVALGAGVLWISGEGRRNHMPIGLSYSFDMLLPIVRLRDAHYDIDLKGWPRYYFYCHKLMGWVLASFLVAGLSGLTK
jgi:hypothetical protein